MPPKQAAKANVVEEKTFDDGTGIKKNIINFKFFADISYINELENCNILFEWLDQDGNKKTGSKHFSSAQWKLELFLGNGAGQELNGAKWSQKKVGLMLWLQNTIKMSVLH